MRWFTLRNVDPKTNCFLEQAHFETSDTESLQELADIESTNPGTSWRLNAKETRQLLDHYGLTFSFPVEEGELICDYAAPGESDQLTHTGRELLLMLAGKKPLAVFSEVLPDDELLGLIPEKYFAPHVASGLISKFERLEDMEKRKHRRVMYALKDEEWRFEACLMLWTLAAATGWNDGFEKCEGFLLGYSDPKYVSLRQRSPETQFHRLLKRPVKSL